MDQEPAHITALRAAADQAEAATQALAEAIARSAEESEREEQNR